MADVDAIIEKVVAALRAKGGRARFSGRAYDDEPILRRGSQMPGYLPERIREMRALASSPEARSWSDARLFVEQARLMEDFEDDLPYHGSFMSLYPTYSDMSNAQLRGYFTWRSLVRAGTVEQTSTSFVYVYLYELINGVGTEPGERGFRDIEAFWRAYPARDATMDRHVRSWLTDYAVYHDLDPALALPHTDEAHDRAVSVLEREQRSVLSAPPTKGRRVPYPHGTREDAEHRLLEALDVLSTYRLTASRLYRDAPDDLRRVSCAVFDRLVRHYHAQRSQDLVESLFGERRKMPHLMFASAVFLPGARHGDCVYELGEGRHYECRGGSWTCESLHDGGDRSAKLGQVLRAVDRQLRKALDHPHPLKERGDPKYLTRLIDREIADYLSWRREHAPLRVEIDLSKLAGIRRGAAITREALLVDEEREEVPGTIGDPSPRPNQSPAGTPDDTLALSAEERALLQGLLDPSAPAPTDTDLLVDSINEKLFDLVGDTVIEFGETGAPHLVEDYLDEVRNLL